jgi:hypothetical protein
MTRFFGRTIVAAGLLIPWPFVAHAQENGDTPRAAQEPTADEVRAIVARAESMLEDIKPSPIQPAGRGEWKIMERPGGTVRWGNFLRPDRVAALVNVTQAGEENEFDPLRQDLCFFEWENGRWHFRQFLGNAADLEVHYREDSPEVFLQGSFRTGRYEGGFVSWFLDKETGRLVPTGFGDSGPFYLAGNYLVGERGFERLAHDSTWWVHPYRDGKKGPLLARLHQTDTGNFDVTYRDDATGEWRSWIFTQNADDTSRMNVTVATDRTQGAAGEPDPDSAKPIGKGRIDSAVDSGQVFGLLTGLDPAILEE